MDNRSEIQFDPNRLLTTQEYSLFHRSPKPFTNELAAALTPIPDIQTLAAAKEAFRPEMLTPFGASVAEVVRDHHVIDLGCGPEKANTIPRALARASHAISYTGVDIEDLGIETPDTFPESFVKADMLSFLQSLQQQEKGLVFIVSGMEPYYYEVDGRQGGGGRLPWDEFAKKRDLTREYITSCLNEMKRVTVQGDGLLIGSATVGWEPSNFGFASKNTTNGSELFVKV